MEILYVTTMVAIFVLCMALLFTARRILHSSPLSSGELALSRMYETQAPEDFSANPARAEIDFEEPADTWQDSVLPNPFEPEAVETKPIMASWVPTPVASTVRTAPEKFVAKTTVPEPVAAGATTAHAPAEPPVSASPTHPPVSGFTERIVEEAAAARPDEKKATRSRKPLPHSYNYALECLLLGVSVLVLFTTQRSASRKRSAPSSHHRVA